MSPSSACDEYVLSGKQMWLRLGGDYPKPALAALAGDGSWVDT